MSQFDRDFAELLKLDAARRGPKPAQPVATVEADDEDDNPDAIAAEDMADIDGQIERSRRRYRRGRDPDQLTDRHIEFARRLAQGIEPAVAANTPPLRYRLRAIRSLLSTPLFVAAYEALRSERSPSIEQLREAVRPHCGSPRPTPLNTPPPSRPVSPGAGYLIRLHTRTNP